MRSTPNVLSLGCLNNQRVFRRPRVRFTTRAGSPFVCRAPPNRDARYPADAIHQHLGRVRSSVGIRTCWVYMDAIRNPLTPRSIMPWMSWVWTRRSRRFPRRQQVVVQQRGGQRAADDLTGERVRGDPVGQQTEGGRLLVRKLRASMLGR